MYVRIHKYVCELCVHVCALLYVYVCTLLAKKYVINNMFAVCVRILVLMYGAYSVHILPEQNKMSTFL